MVFCIEARERGWLWIGPASTDGFLPRLPARQLYSLFQNSPELQAKPDKVADGLPLSYRFPSQQYDAVWDSLRSNQIECAPRSLVVDGFYDTFPVADTLDQDFRAKYLDKVHLDGQHIMPFQKEGIRFGISQRGRCLIGDEPGCGKTLQAIGIAYEYQEDWPILVIVPSSLRSVWKLQLELWGRNIISPNEVQIIYEGKVPISPISKIVVTSYELANLNAEKFINHKFKILICDEAHKIKNSQAQRTKTVVDLAANAKRIILMTGTPIVNLATDVFQLLKVIAGSETEKFPSQTGFEERYFLKREKSFKGKIQCMLPCREHELHAVLESTVMIRRLKRDVLSQMPDKFRSPIELDIAVVQEIKEFRSMTIQGEYDALKENDLQRLFHETCKFKKEASTTYVAEVIDCTIHDKYLVFAHHVEMLDGLESVLTKAITHQGGSLIRICGKTPMKQRGDLVHKFQTEPKCRVAILSITACAEGITLTAASNIIFAELHWTPAIMNQCEGRAHRMGQKNNVHIQYLLTPGKDSVDHKAYEALTEKQRHCDRIIDGLDDTRQEDAFPRYMTEKPKVLSNLEMNKKAKLFPKRLCRPAAPKSKVSEEGIANQTSSSSDCVAGGRIPAAPIPLRPGGNVPCRELPKPRGLQDSKFRPNILAGRRIIEKPMRVIDLDLTDEPSCPSRASPSPVVSSPSPDPSTSSKQSIPSAQFCPKAVSSKSPPAQNRNASHVFREEAKNGDANASIPESRKTIPRRMSDAERRLLDMKTAILNKLGNSEATRPVSSDKPGANIMMPSTPVSASDVKIAKRARSDSADDAPNGKRITCNGKELPPRAPDAHGDPHISNTSVITAKRARSESADRDAPNGKPITCNGKELPPAGFNRGKQKHRTTLRTCGPGANVKNARGAFGMFVDAERERTLDS